MRYRLAKWGSQFLATRDRGREVREDIASDLAKLAPGDTLIIDFSDIEAVTHSFGDECVAKLLLARGSGDYLDRGLVAEAVSEEVRETLEAVLDRRKLSLILVGSTGTLQVIAGPGWLAETLEAAMKLKSFRASELADALEMTAPAANNRLRALVGAGAVARERGVPEKGGKEFHYTVMVPQYA